MVDPLADNFISNQNAFNENLFVLQRLLELDMVLFVCLCENPIVHQDLPIYLNDPSNSETWKKLIWIRQSSVENHDVLWHCYFDDDCQIQEAKKSHNYYCRRRAGKRPIERQF